MSGRTRLLSLGIALCGALAVPSAASSGAADEAPTSRSQPWPEEVVEIAARLPVQEQGRIKPLSTMASFALLRMHHTRSCDDATGEKLEPTEWLLDVFFFPEAAKTYPLFRVQTHEVLQAIGVSTEGKKKRDLYSYEELEAGRERLLGLTRTYAGLDASARTPLQGQILNLGHNVFEFERLAGFLDFARAELVVDGVPPFATQDDGAHVRRYSELVAGGTDFAMALAQAERGADANPDAQRLLHDVSPMTDRAMGVRLIPPTLEADQRPEWTSPGELMADALMVGPVENEHVGMIAALEGMADSRDRPDEFARHLGEFSAASHGLAGDRGEAQKVGLEVRYYGLDPFYRSLILYLFGFVMVAITWARPKMKRLFTVALATTSAGFVIHTAGIVMRCIIRSRPPISTLYETVIFVAGAAVIVSLFIELVDRRRLAGALAPILGSLGLFIAMRFEELKGEDTMPQLVAVLDTNFWLSIHVTCITLGYAAGLLASAFAHVYVLGKVFGIKKNSREAYRSLGKTVYGTVCFALLFSVVGTILGGIWANYSWGRFWGWDPKENGALMICLSQLALLHGRLGGYLKPFGICMATIASRRHRRVLLVGREPARRRPAQLRLHRRHPYRAEPLLLDRRRRHAPRRGVVDHQPCPDQAGLTVSRRLRGRLRGSRARGPRSRRARGRARSRPSPTRRARPRSGRRAAGGGARPRS